MNKTLLTVCTLGLMNLSPTLFANTYQVEQWGADSGSCGSDADPCLTIQQAIDNASANDKIEVGAGTYTENIDINKEGLKVLSLAGRYATTIVAASTADDAVDITASKVQFGKKGQGFTVTGATDFLLNGLHVDLDTRTKLKIEGNRFSGNFRGMVVQGTNHQVRDNQIENNANSGFTCNFCTKLVLEDNAVTDNGIGIEMSFGDQSSLIRNRVSNTSSDGILLSSSSTDTRLKDNVSEGSGSRGIFVGDVVGSTIQGNIAANNDVDGFQLDQDTSGETPEIKNNLAVDNGNDGFWLNELESAQFKGNSAIDNGDDGVITLPGTTFSNFKNNNTTNSGDCGIENISGTDISYSNHWFGDAAGPNSPGSNDGVCGTDASTGSFATQPNSLTVNNAAKL